MTMRRRLGMLIERAGLWLLISLLLTVGVVLPGSTVGAEESVPTLASGQPTQRSTTAVGTWGDGQGVRSVRATPTVTSITPGSGYNNGVVHITNLAGSGFEAGAGVALIRGQEVISATSVVVSASQITCDFDLRGGSPGKWTVRVVNPGDEYGELADGFTVKGLFYLPKVMRNWPPIQTGKFYAVADAGVLQGASTTSFGSATDMWVGYDHCSNRQIGRSLVQFDVSSILPGAVVEATLYLRLDNSCDIGERTHIATVYRTSASWSESSVTWNTQPGSAEAYGSASIPSRTWGWYSFDVTDLVRGWVGGSYSNYGLMVRGPESSGSDSARLGFLTHENSGTTYDPYLEITYYGTGACKREGPAVGEIPNPTGCGSTVEDMLGILPGASSYGMFEAVERRTCSSD